MGALFAASLVIALIAILSIVHAKHRRERLSKLAAIARELGGTHDRSSVTCTRDGIVVRFDFATRGDASASESWTEVTADLPRGYPLTLRVVPGEPQPDAVKRGELVDIEVGEPVFDHAFIVEAAPTDVVRHLLDEPARAFLLQFGGVLATTKTASGAEVLQLGIPGWDEDPVRASLLVDGVARIA